MAVISLGQQVLAFVVQIVLARLLVPKDYGVVALVMTIGSFAVVFSTAGIATALVQRKELPAVTVHDGTAESACRIGLDPGRRTRGDIVPAVVFVGLREVVQAVAIVEIFEDVFAGKSGNVHERIGFGSRFERERGDNGISGNYGEQACGYVGEYVIASGARGHVGGSFQAQEFKDFIVNRRSRTQRERCRRGELNLRRDFGFRNGGLEFAPVHECRICPGDTFDKAVPAGTFVRERIEAD